MNDDTILRTKVPARRLHRAEKILRKMCDVDVEHNRHHERQSRIVEAECY